MKGREKLPPIGPTILRERKNRDLTLEQLAARSGVSKSMLSQIERSRANPTVAVLWSLTRALNIKLVDLIEGTLVDPGDSTIELLTAAHTPEMRSGNGDCRLRILNPPGMAGQTEWYMVEIAPLGNLESAPHAAGAFEHLTALSPGLEVTSGTSMVALRNGETARYPADLPHKIVNTATKTARAIMVLQYR